MSINVIIMPNYLVIGGISSGKSSYAEQIVKDVCKVNKNSKIYYLATAPITDDEMYEKIRIHQDRRPKDWTTIEEEIDIVSRIMEIEETNIIVLIECLTTWLSNLIFHKADLDYNTEKLINFLATNTDATIILVTNDLSESVISANKETREFQKYNGKLNQDTAKICDSVYKVTAGIGIRIK